MSDSETDPQERLAGVLVPVFAIRREGDLGIGDTRGVREMIDWVADNGMQFLQFLPINEMAGDNSPYNAISSVALDPLTLEVSPEAIPDLDPAVFESILEKTDLEALRGPKVDYTAVRRLKSDLLWQAFGRFRDRHAHQGTPRETAFVNFCSRESDWLYAYCIFRLFMDMELGLENWETWPQEYNTLEKAQAYLDLMLKASQDQTEHQLAFYAYVQFLAFEQWQDVAEHARKRNVHLMGDIPYGVSRTSVDVFAQTHLFDLEWCGGAPPERNFKDDEFTVRWGQNWGIPLYRWDLMEKNGFAWWKQRVGKTCRIFDIFRIDHALGFYRIYSFPWRPERNAEFLHLSDEEAKELASGHLPGFKPRPDDTVENRAYNRERGETYYRAIREAAGDSHIVAEDLGLVPEYVPESLLGLGFAIMKVPQWEAHPDGEFKATEDYPYLSLTTYATHDHEPIRTQWEKARLTVLNDASPDASGEAAWFLHRMARFARIEGIHDNAFPPFDDRIREAMLRRLFEASSRYAAVMITDLLGLEDRFNVPGTLSDANWTHRLPMTVQELREKSPWRERIASMKNLLKDTGRFGQPD